MTQKPESITVSAPGSIMITGEHAVVYGHRAIVAAIEQRVEVTLRRRTDGLVRVTSEIAPPLECSATALRQGGPYKFVLAALEVHKSAIASGCDVNIHSEIDPTLGLGSSAAVTIATLGALSSWSSSTETKQLHCDALKIVQGIQGRGSGADLAASLMGGLISYRAPTSEDNNAEISPLPLQQVPVSLRYCGYKTPTAEVLRLIAERRVGQEAFFDALYKRMGEAAEKAIQAAQSNDAAFYAALSTYQGLMVELGVSDPTLDQIIADATRAPETLAAKISGSGLGDCVAAFGPTPVDFRPVTIATEGLVVHD